MGVEVPEESLSALQPGDHIKFERRPGYDHHAIVEEVDLKHRAVRVIEYGSDEGGSSFRKGVVKRSVVYDIRGMYKYFYYNCLDAATVLKRAVERLGERNYNPFTNNCEHFATWCKTGSKWCSQIAPFAVRATVTGAAGGFGGCGTAVGRYAAGRQALAAATGLGKCGVRETIAAGGREAGRNGLKCLCKTGVVAGISLVVESCLFGYNCYKAQKKYKEGMAQIGDDDNLKQKLRQKRNRSIARAGCEGVGGVIGGTVGAIALGSWIPVVGTAVGSVVGSIAGRLIGRLFGSLFR